MKNILFLFLLLSTTLFAQQNDKKWEQVIAFENEGKTKSASEIVDKIHKKAIRDKDEVQIIKCFFYQSKYIQILEEDAQTKIINNLKTAINQVSIPSKAILRLVYVKSLKDYATRNDYKIRQRTKTEIHDDNFLTWTEDNFIQEINKVLKQTLNDESILKNTPLTKYEPVFDYSFAENFKNQNLFNYVLKENIAIYSQELRLWEINNAALKIHKKELLSSSADFVKLNYDSIPKGNFQTALSLYQKQEINYPTADNQFDRILFLKKIFIEADDDYLNALNMLQKSTKDILVIQKIQLEKASILYSRPAKEADPDYNIKVVAILDSILKIENRSNAYKSALQLKQNIKAKTITVQLQKYTYNNQNTRAFIEYKNVEQLKVSFYKIDQKQLAYFNQFHNIRDSLVDAIVKKGQLISSESYELKNKKDYFTHTTEVLLPNLKLGSYLVYFESESDSKDKKAFVYETITTSNLTLLASQKTNEDLFQVLDRKTGKPLENVTIKLPSIQLKTDKDGQASYKYSTYYSYNDIELFLENDTLSIVKNYIQYAVDYKQTVKDNPKGKVEFYLDRAIYRPGQTVYYKGIAVQKNTDKTRVVANTTFKITIEDPESNDLKEFEATTNEFGSFSGEFILPKTGLTGNYRITADESHYYEKDAAYNKKKDEHPFWDHIDFENSEIDFSVEEYKRPKFEITFDPKKESFQVNQSIKVNGTAKAFAGSSISDAKVTYTVTRYVSYYRNYGLEQNEEVAAGETKTDASGKFTVDFIAKPSNNSVKDNLPIFNYQIQVSVTDINGETHEAVTSVKVGYHNLVLITTLPNEIKTKDKNEVLLNSTNLNDEFTAVKGDLKVYFVNSTYDKFKTRVWRQPEIESISNEDFEKLFPYENNLKSTADKTNETLVYSTKIDTEKDKKLALDFMADYKSGYYKIVFSAKDSFDNLIEAVSNFKLTQSNDKFDKSKLFTAEQINPDPKKDGFVLIKLTSVIPELYIITTGNYQGTIFFEATNLVKNNETVVKIPLKSEFKDLLRFRFESIFENQVVNTEMAVTLKSIIPKLEWKVESFRSKIQPGSNENWSFQLTAGNAKKEAEVLVSMYDSSLDQFAVRNWNNLDINEYYSNSTNAKTSLGFQDTYASFKNLNTSLKGLLLNKESINLMWFGFDFNNSNPVYLQKLYIKQLEKKIKKPANAKLISGVVTDSKGEPIPGVTVTIKDTKRRIFSDFDGYYEIEAANGEELIFSYIGSKTQSALATEKREINIILEDDSNRLEEVVVVGYGTMKKSDLTGAVSMIKMKTSAEGDGENFSTMLQGRVSGVQINNSKVVIRGASSTNPFQGVLYIIDGEIATEEAFKNLKTSDIVSFDILDKNKAGVLYGSKAVNGAIIITTKKAIDELTQVKARKNLSETAFFLPNLKTDSKGNVSFNFTSPESLTAWRLRLFAHNKDAVSGYLEKTVVTQKDLMVLPNFPRFFREKDTIVISTKISNVTNEAKTGIAMLQFFDATTMESIDAKMLNAKNIKNFTIDAFGNTTATWKIYIPEGLQGVQYKIVAKAGNFSDGEENILPVLTNNMLVTESIPIWVRENSKKEYTFENLKNNTSTTLRNHQFTLEYTSNPAWIAIQSLPYLMEYEHECAEQTFARFYGNALASEIISSNPKIATVFENWRKNGKLNSKLEENEELKSIILAETPWLNDAKSEDEKKKNFALLFDLEKMKTSQEATFQKLKQKQKASGGFSWFDGGYESEYITRHILAGLGHLSILDKTPDNLSKIDEIAKTGIPYLDQKFLESYKERTKYLKTNEKLIWGDPNSDLHYLYTRSFYLEKYPLSDTLRKASKLYLETAKKDWLSYSLYEKGLAALTLNRLGEKAAAKTILESLKETSSTNEDWGMYWITNNSGWYWYQAPIETQALLIEAFAEINNDTKSVDAMKVWLLKNKQTKNWPTTKSTTEAIYALLMQGTDWLSVKDNTVIKIGDEKILTKKLTENQKEAETGYIKLNWKAEEVKKEMASVSIENKSKVPGFGGVYWQYFEDLDKIKNNSGAVLSVTKELYFKKNTLKGNELEKITSTNSLKVGDLVTVRLIISSKEDTEYVHLKDMRASCFEPVNVLSEYQYKDGLGYYMSTKDAATHLFFDRINKGAYVIEYDIRVNNSGEFSNGITTIESMYAPEFTSHTKGIRVKVQ
ncbi:MG2 domain-containing protein [Flavobacterium sp. MC2016-06]|uniref:alpha-2-macroglobulin family protein n=1 Tax=Flavobacterium sp. MC2016-06 TaxID=2676308 RepID=UPI0012BAC619|nr:MG2 domain-containing protein [Flavobacterium sp. MC2016-06]MBU3858561.1 carboxypeptidase-like regulatory domain-containing protein [Flavobacterium sp. MC2016-06]